MKPRINLFLCLGALATTAIAFSGAAFGADSTIATQANNYSWNQLTWTAGVPGATSGTTNTDIATFNNAGHFTVNGFNANRNIGGIQFDTTGATANNYVFTSSGNLLLTSGGSISTASSYKGVTNINLAPVLQGSAGSYSLTSNGASGSGLILSAIAPAVSLGTYTLNLNGTNTGVYNQVTGAIADAAGTTVLSLNKSGAGTWLISGTNTYSGGTTLNGGTVITNATGALASTGTISVTGSTTIRTTAAPTDPSARITISDGATLTIDSVGSSSNTWVGALGNSGASNTAGLTKTGLGTMTIQTATQTYKGDTTVNAGVLTIKANAQTNLVDSASKLVLGGGTLNFTGTVSTTSSQTFNGTTLNAGISQFLPAATTGTNTVDFGAITRNTGSLLNVTSAGGYTLKATGTTTDAGGLIKGVFYSQNDFAKVTADVLGAGTYSTQNDASLWSSNTVNYVTNGAVSGTVGTTTINALKLNNASSQSFAIAGTLTVNDGILFGSSIGANASEVSGGNLTANGDLVVVCNNAQNSYGRNTISSTIVNNGPTTNVILYTPLNGGNLFISGANSYTGDTYVAGGYNTTGNTGIVTIGGASGAQIGSASASVHINGGNGGTASVLRVGNGDATGDILGTVRIENGTLQLNRNDTSTLTATVTGSKGAGIISVSNTGTTTLNFASGNNTFYGIGGTAAGTLNLSGAGSVNTFVAPQPYAAGFNAGQTTNFISGTYYFNSPGNSGSAVYGAWNIQGADVVLASMRYFKRDGGTVSISSGSLTSRGQFSPGEQASGATIAFNVSGTGLLNLASNAQGIGLGGGASANTVSLNISGGGFQYGLAPGSNGAQGFTIGTTTAGNVGSLNLSGGVARVFGTIQGAVAGAGGSSNFNWTGGRLTALAVNMTNLTSNDGVSSPATGTLFQGGSTAVLAPGELFNGYNYTGKTTISGNYQIDGGSFSVGIGGTTQAATFHDFSNKYDTLTVSGTAALAGNLSVALLPGFTPANSDTFTILTGTGGVSGAFSNVSLGKVTLSGGATFDVTVGATTVVLSNYTAAAGNTYASWIAGYSVGGLIAANDDYDNDDLDNVVENVLGSNPSVYSNGLTQVSATAGSFKFRHNQSNTIASDVTPSYQWSTDLVEWKTSGQANTGGTTATITTSTITDTIAPLNDEIEVTVTVTSGPATKVFGRLVATKAP